MRWFAVPLLMISSAVSAQTYGSAYEIIGSWTQNFGTDLAITNANNAALQASLSQSFNGEVAESDDSSASPESHSGDRAIEAVDLSYTPSLARRKTNIESFARKSRAVDPVGSAQMLELFRQGDFIAQMDTELAKKGLSVNNVADAYTVYWISAWQAANGDTSDVSTQAAQAVKRQVEAAFAATPQASATTGALKQELAEAFVVQAALIEALNEKYRDDPELGPKLRAAVRQGSKAAGVELGALTLTEDGFRA